MMRWRVVWGRSAVIASFWPTIRLSRVDFPTLGRPTMATWPQRCSAGMVARTAPSVVPPGSVSGTAHRTGGLAACLGRAARAPGARAGGVGTGLGRFERELRRDLFGGAAAAAAAEDLDIQLGDRALDFEHLLVCRSMGGDDRIDRQRQLAALQMFLEQGLGVLAERPRVDGAQDGPVERPDHALGCLEAAVQVDRPEHCLEGIGE